MEKTCIKVTSNTDNKNLSASIIHALKTDREVDVLTFNFSQKFKMISAYVVVDKYFSDMKVVLLNKVESFEFNGEKVNKFTFIVQPK